jgi:hypothetical protein
MSKNYHMVQYVFPPDTMPTNIELRTVIYEAADRYIKQGKLAMAGTRIWYQPNFSNSRSYFDYRDSHISNRYFKNEDGNPNVWNISTPWDVTVPQIFYRIFLDATAANEFIQLVLDHGALVARVITEEQAGLEIEGFTVPADVFTPEEVVAKFVWPGYPNFEYNGTYPTAGSPTAEPYSAS